MATNFRGRVKSSRPVARAPKHSQMGLGIWIGLGLAGIIVGTWFLMSRPNAAKTGTTESLSAESEHSVKPSPDSSQGLWLDLGNGVKIELVLVPAGTFTMGSAETEAKQFGAPAREPQNPVDKDNVKPPSMRAPTTAFTGRIDNEGPQHKVTISKSFYMSRFTITEAQYAPIMGINWRIATNPVVNVSWDEAQDFCRRVGLANKVQVSLPTEAEWEYACRAGTTTPYYFGDEIHAEVRPGPNGFGLFDMDGRIWQWCEDYYSESNYYERSPKADPKGVAKADAKDHSSGICHVVRGGFWPSTLGGSRSASRYWYPCTLRSENIGFRVIVRP